MPSRSTLRDLNTLLEARQRDREALASQLSEVDEDIVGLQRSIRMVTAALAESDPDATQAKEIRNAIVSILNQHGQPLHYHDIHRRLGEQGIEVRGKDPLRNVSAHLSNDNRFASVDRRGYWALKSWPADRKIVPRDDQLPPVVVEAQPDQQRGTVVRLHDRVRAGSHAEEMERIRRAAQWRTEEVEVDDDESEEEEVADADEDNYEQYLVPAVGDSQWRSSAPNDPDLDDVPF